MPIYEVVLGIVLTTMVGILFVSPIYLFERYILWDALDEYIDSTVIKAVACVVINVAIFLIGYATVLATAGYKIQQANSHENVRRLCCLRLRQRGVIKMEKCCKESRRQRTFLAVTQTVSSGMR